VICIELNLPPPSDDAQAQENLNRAQQEVELITQEYTQIGEKFPATLVILTNYPSIWAARRARSAGLPVRHRDS
jgi:hypothetical protein